MHRRSRPSRIIDAEMRHAASMNRMKTTIGKPRADSLKLERCPEENLTHRLAVGVVVTLLLTVRIHEKKGGEIGLSGNVAGREKVSVAGKTVVAV